jgi:hypothetical protein
LAFYLALAGASRQAILADRFGDFQREQLARLASKQWAA